VTIATALALSVLAYGVDVHRAWLGDAIGPHAGTVLTALNNQSLVAQLARLLGGDPVHSYRPSPLPVVLAATRWTVVAAVVLAWIAIRRGLPARAALDLDFALGIALMPFVSPIFWLHYFLLSLVALLVLSRHAARAGPGTWLLRGTLAAAYLLAAWYPPPDTTWYGRAPGFWTELLNGRFFYGSGFLAAACFIAARGRSGAA